MQKEFTRRDVLPQREPHWTGTLPLTAAVESHPSNLLIVIFYGD